MAPAWLMSCSGFGPPSKTPADPSPARCLWQLRTILSQKVVAKEQVPCLGLGAEPRTVPVGLHSKTPTKLSRLVAALCSEGEPGLLGKGQAEATKARLCWQLQAQEGFLQWGWRLQQHLS